MMLREIYSSIRSGWYRRPAITLICACILFGLGASAQNVTSEQAEIFRNLGADEQRAVLEAFRGRGGSGSDADGFSSDENRDSQGFRRPRRAGDDADEPTNDRNRMPRIPKLKGGDTVILSLEIKDFETPLLMPSAPPIPQAEGTQGVPNGQVREDAKRAGPEKKITRTDDQTERLLDFRDRVKRRNPYRLDETGVLIVPELGSIELGGLTEEQARQRLSADVSLRDFNVAILRLPLLPTGNDALKPYGYEFFTGETSTFAPANDVPVPSEYVIGPGDSIEVQLVGNTKVRSTLSVDREGRLRFPELGAITVGGMRFDDMRAMLEKRVSEQMIGTQVTIGIGKLRTIRVYIVGEAERPGTYVVSGLTTITGALYASGGIKKIGSLRNIQLKRNGYTVAAYDLYDFLLKGDTRGDRRLQPGDVILVPPVGPTVGVSGEVLRPAIYELKNETCAADVLQLAGGLTPKADSSLARLERVNDQRQRVTVGVNLAGKSGKDQRLYTGDMLRVPAIRPVLEGSVSLVGNVYRQGEFQFVPGMRLTDVISSMDELMPNSDRRYLLIRRELPPDRRVSVFSADLEFALSSPSSAANFELSPRDRIHVFDLESGRDRIIMPLMRELRMQSQIDEPTREVTVAGKVKVPGKYPFESGMRVADLLRAGGSLDEAAYGAKAELTRYVVVNGEKRIAQLTEIELRAALEGDPKANVPLQPFDYLMVKELPLWETQEAVDLRGEVRFPGRYPIARGETFRSVLQRAGGLTDFAFAAGAVFTRTELQERERKQLDTLATRLQNDLTQLSLVAAKESQANTGEALAVGQSLLANLRSTDVVGRLVIDVEKSARAEPGSELDIVLKDGDRLLVPRVSQEVTVIGEVQSATSHLYRRDLTRGDYIGMSGGYTPRAGQDNVYVVRADGSVVTGAGRAWFLGGGVEMQPGDTIVVPLDTDRVRPLSTFSAISTIVYNLAIAVAAVNSF
jgi:protein involved in polysaccharide export with SLBB domain